MTNTAELASRADEAPQTRQEWAAKITSTYRRSIEAMIATGRYLIAAKDSLAHGEFGKMFENKEVPFCARHGQRFIAIASDERITTHVSHLPCDILAVYELTRLSEAEFSEALTAGKIHPEMTRADAEALRKSDSPMHPSDAPHRPALRN